MNTNWLHHERGSRKFAAGMSWRTCESEGELDGWLDAAATFVSYEIEDAAGALVVELLSDMVALFNKRRVSHDN
jgi:hypothetical protein